MRPKTFHVLLMAVSAIITVLVFWLAKKVLFPTPTNLFFGLAMLAIGVILVPADFFLACMWLDVWSKRR